MILDSIKISAFRGIKQTLPLDLRAHITLIHAPNGVGKTSICDAVEWLFTGDVERLHQSLGKSKKSVTNIFAASPPSVECEVQNGGGPTLIRRSEGTKASEVEFFRNGRWNKETLNTLLDNITPENLPQTSKGLQRLNTRRNWFRAVRLLEAHALNLLLDTNESGNEVRDLVFCDLLGVGELQRHERDLLKIVAAIGGKSRFQRELLKIRNAIALREKEIASEIVQASAPLLQTYHQQIEDAARKLNTNALLRPGPPESYLVDVENAAALAVRKIDEQRRALDYVTINQDKYETLDYEIARLLKELRELETKRFEAQQQTHTASALLQTLESDRFQAEALAESLMSQPLEPLKADLEVSLSKWRVLSGDLDTRIDLSEGHRRLESLRQKSLDARQFLSNVVKCQTSLKLWREARVREQAAAEKLRNLKSPNSKERADLEQALSMARANFTKIETRFSEVATPLEELRIAARNFLNEAKDEQVCPLCAHDHNTPAILRAAVETGLSKIPISIDQLAVQKQAFESKIAEAEQQLRLWNAEADALAIQTTELEECRLVLSDAMPVLGGIGITLDELSSEGLDERLAELSWQAKAQLEHTEIMESNENDRFKTERELQSNAQRSRSIFESLREFEPNTGVTYLEELPPKDWLQVVDDLAKNFELAWSAARDEAVTLRKSCDETRSRLSTLTQEISTLTMSMDQTSRKVNEAKAAKDEFVNAWRLVAREQTWDSELLDNFRQEIEQGLEEVVESRQRVESARLTLASARAAEVRERERAAIQRELAELRAQFSETEAVIHVREECVKGINQLRAAKDAFIKEQIQPLCDVITALYVRAQSAAFIDRIDSSQDDGPLRWLARIGENHLENTAQMSLGQRQDLALAIFLSRARELGGTFFLDEPLLNLDDLNRIAVLDVLRTIVIEDRPQPIRLVVTTANQSLVRHCREKFSLVDGATDTPALNIYHLVGDPQTGVSAVLDN